MLNHLVRFSQQFHVVQPFLSFGLKSSYSLVAFFINLLKLLHCGLNFAQRVRVLFGFLLVVEVKLGVRRLQV